MRALLQLDDGDDVGHALGEGGMGGPVSDGEGVYGAPARGLDPAELASSAARAAVTGVEDVALAGRAALDQKLVSAGSLPEGLAQGG